MMKGKWSMRSVQSGSRILLPVRPAHNRIYDCIENVFNTAAEWVGADCSLMFVHSWGFGYVTKDAPYPPKMFCESRGYSYIPAFKVLHEQLNYRVCTNKCTDYDSLRRYEGLIIEEHRVDGFTGFLELIHTSLSSGMPVGAHIDSYWCPWDPTYKQNHMIHYCLVIGVDPEKAIAYCLDPYLNNNVNEMPFECFKNGCGTCYTFSRKEPEASISDPKEIAGKIALFSKQKRDGHDTFEYMKMLASELGGMRNLDAIICDYTDYQTVPFFILMSHVSWTRKNIAILLEKLDHEANTDFLENTVKDFEQASTQWGIIRSKLVKACILNRYDRLLPEAANLLASLSSFEEELAGRILFMCR